MRKSSPSWTMIGKQKRSTKEPTPGPGDYTITSTESIKFPVTTSQRKDISPGRESPGPGAYSPSQASSSPKIT
jgi:Sperm-tail PG-rich repeat